MIISGINLGTLIWDRRLISQHFCLSRLRFLFGVSMRGYTNIITVSLESEKVLLRQLDTVRTRRHMPLVVGVDVTYQEPEVSLRDFALILGRHQYATWGFPVVVIVYDNEPAARHLAKMQVHTNIPIILGCTSGMPPEIVPQWDTHLYNALSVEAVSDGSELPGWIEAARRLGITKPIMAGGAIPHRLVPEILSAGADAVFLSSWSAPWRMRTLVAHLDRESRRRTKNDYVGRITTQQHLK